MSKRMILAVMLILSLSLAAVAGVNINTADVKTLESHMGSYR